MKINIFSLLFISNVSVVFSQEIDGYNFIGNSIKCLDTNKFRNKISNVDSMNVDECASRCTDEEQCGYFFLIGDVTPKVCYLQNRASCDTSGERRDANEGTVLYEKVTHSPTRLPTSSPVTQPPVASVVGPDLPDFIRLRSTKCDTSSMEPYITNDKFLGLVPQDESDMHPCVDLCKNDEFCKWMVLDTIEMKCYFYKNEDCVQIFDDDFTTYSSLTIQFPNYDFSQNRKCKTVDSGSTKTNVDNALSTKEKRSLCSDFCDETRAARTTEGDDCVAWQYNYISRDCTLLSKCESQGSASEQDLYELLPPTISPTNAPTSPTDAPTSRPTRVNGYDGYDGPVQDKACKFVASEQTGYQVGFDIDDCKEACDALDEICSFWYYNYTSVECHLHDKCTFIDSVGSSVFIQIPVIIPTNQPTDSPTKTPSAAPTTIVTVSGFDLFIGFKCTSDGLLQQGGVDSTTDLTVEDCGDTCSVSSQCKFFYYTSTNECTHHTACISVVDSSTLLYQISSTNEPTLSPAVAPTEQDSYDEFIGPAIDKTCASGSTIVSVLSGITKPECAFQCTLEPNCMYFSYNRVLIDCVMFSECTITDDNDTDLYERLPTDSPSASPSVSPSSTPTVSPTTSVPTASPETDVEYYPTESPTESPSNSPTNAPTNTPTRSPTDAPSKTPSRSPTNRPSESPTIPPTDSGIGTRGPTISPTDSPSKHPTVSPTDVPTDAPTESPTESPTTVSPTASPSTPIPSFSPTTESPSTSPTTTSPSFSPTTFPTVSPTTDGDTGLSDETITYIVAGSIVTTASIAGVILLVFVL